MKCPTEIAISDRREAELAKNGFMPLIHKKNSDFAAFIGAQSLQKPAEYDDPDATANANLAARLPYLFATCRFAHYLKCIVRDKIGSFKERDDMQRWLQNWIMQYVDGDPAALDRGRSRRASRWRRRGRGRGGRREPGLLHVEVLPAAALPARGADRFAAAHLEAAVGEGGLITGGRSRRMSGDLSVVANDNWKRKERRVMAVDMFLKIPMMSRVNRLTSSSQGRDRRPVAGAGGCRSRQCGRPGPGAAAGKVNVQDLTFTKYVDKSTPNLMAACCTGTAYDGPVDPDDAQGGRRKPAPVPEDLAGGRHRSRGHAARRPRRLTTRRPRRSR